MLQNGTLRMLTATAGLVALVGCGTYNVTLTDESNPESMRRGRVVNVDGAAGSVAVPVELAPATLEDPMIDFVGDNHGFRAAGMSEEEIAGVVAYIRSFGGNDPVIDEGDGLVQNEGDGIETFDTSCSLCHPTPNVVSTVFDGLPSVDFMPATFQKVGP